MAALLYAQDPACNVVYFRRTYPQLESSVIPRSLEWLANTGASYNSQQHLWGFPSGARLKFAHLATEIDKLDYQSAEYSTIIFDELTQFTETSYRYLFSRLRRTVSSQIPLRMLSASNPGGPGGDWVEGRFIGGQPTSQPLSLAPERLFLPSRLRDNPHLDPDEYAATLSELDPTTLRQLLDGDWTARTPGDWFKRSDFQIVDELPFIASAVRYWDFAASKPKAHNPDPDWTVGLLLGKGDDGFLYVIDVVRFREGPGQTKTHVRQAAISDVKWRAATWIEQEPGASGVIAADHYIREVLAGHEVYAEKQQANKQARAKPVVSTATRGGIRLLRGPWNRPFLDELEAFPQIGIHDDVVDALSGAHSKLTKSKLLIFDPSAPPDPSEARSGWDGYDLDD